MFVPMQVPRTPASPVRSLLKLGAQVPPDAEQHQAIEAVKDLRIQDHMLGVANEAAAIRAASAWLADEPPDGRDGRRYVTVSNRRGQRSVRRRQRRVQSAPRAPFSRIHTPLTKCVPISTKFGRVLPLWPKSDRNRADSGRARPNLARCLPELDHIRQTPRTLGQIRAELAYVASGMSFVATLQHEPRGSPVHMRQHLWPVVLCAMPAVMA